MNLGVPLFIWFRVSVHVRYCFVLTDVPVFDCTDIPSVIIAIFICIIPTSS